MSEANDGGPAKKRRLRGSCDSCAHRKIKCDAAIVGPGKRCSNCVNFNTQCTKERGGRHDEFASARSLVASISRAKAYNPPNDKNTQIAHVMELVNYARHLERSFAAFKNSIPASSPPEHADGPPIDAPVETYVSSYREDKEDDDSEEEKEEVEVQMDYLEGTPTAPRFFGTLSNISLVKSAFEELQIDDKPEACDPSTSTAATQWARPPTPTPDVHPFRRPQYWIAPNWVLKMVKADNARRHVFPPPDLMNSLIDLYFIYNNPYLPVLHQPTFLKDIEDGLHHRNPHFADLLLIVCATAARFSQDPRSRCPNGHPGWHYYEQVKAIPDFTAPASLYQLQTGCLACVYLHDAPPPLSTNCWPILGVLMRQAQDVGLHRLKSPPSAETEPWKRVFWIILSIDVILSACHGRPRATSLTDYDITPINEVDDQYWDTFKQPPSKPSTISFIAEFIKLMDILGFAQRTLFAVKRPVKGDAKVWTSNVLAQLNKALDSWRESLPDHLKRDPNQQDPVFFAQSAYLDAGYAWVKILIYRPFIPLRPKNLSFAFAALSESVIAARMCTSAMYAIYERNIPLAMPHFQMALLSSGVVLVLQTRIGHKRGIATNRQMDITNVYKVMEILKFKEETFLASGRFYDILNEMLHVDDRSSSASEGSDIGTPSTASHTSNKRAANRDDTPGFCDFIPEFASPPVPQKPLQQDQQYTYNDPYDPYAVASSVVSIEGNGQVVDMDFDINSIFESQIWDPSGVLRGVGSAAETVPQDGWPQQQPQPMPLQPMGITPGTASGGFPEWDQAMNSATAVPAPAVPAAGQWSGTNPPGLYFGPESGLGNLAFGPLFPPATLAPPPARNPALGVPASTTTSAGQADGSTTGWWPS
ncbi:fungal-specific transcription factor domain-containing protein [Flagelloscypha sp. PMI_526]|nr:fungal-specific transcription factor domain-containing protein [Flagelloscypha sp. PMI_526]